MSVTTREQSRELKKTKNEMLHAYMWIKMKDPNTTELTDPASKNVLLYDTKFTVPREIVALMGETKNTILIHEKTTLNETGMASDVVGEFGGAKFSCSIEYVSDESITTVSATVNITGVELFVGALDAACYLWLNEYFDQLQNTNIPGA